MFEKTLQNLIEVFTVRLTQPVARGRGRGLVPAFAFARGGGALRSLRDLGRRGAELEKQFRSGLKGPQTSQPPTIWLEPALHPRLSGSCPRCSGADCGGVEAAALASVDAAEGLRSSERCGENPIGGGG